MTVAELKKELNRYPGFSEIYLKSSDGDHVEINISEHFNEAEDYEYLLLEEKV